MFQNSEDGLCASNENTIEAACFVEDSENDKFANLNNFYQESLIED